MTITPIVVDSMPTGDPNMYVDKMSGWTVDFANMQIIDNETGRCKKIRRVDGPVQWQFSMREYCASSGVPIHIKGALLKCRSFPHPDELEERYLKFLDKVISDV